MEEQIRTARDMIRKGQYKDARAILNDIDHPLADRMNGYLDGITAMDKQTEATQHKPRNLFIRQLEKLLPYRNIEPSSPLFIYEARQLGWGRTPQDLKRRSRGWIGWVLLWGVGLWLVYAILMLFSGAGDEMNAIFWSILSTAFFVSFLDKFILDFTAILSGLDLVSKDVSEGHWDLVCLSNISTRHIINAKHTTAQIRTWRLTMRVVAFRLLIVILGFLHFFVLPLFLRADYIANPYTALDLGQGIMYLSSLIGGGVFSLGFVIIYVIEPIWRLRALAGASLAISSSLRHPTMALLASFGAVIGVWMMQIVSGIVATIMIAVMSSMFITPITAVFALALYIVAVGMLIYSIYDALARNWVTRARKRLIKHGGAP